MTPEQLERLKEDLQSAVEDAVVGEVLRAGLGNRARSAAQAVLLRHGLRTAKVQVQQEGAGFALAVVLPPGVARVQQLVLRFGAGGWP